MGFPSIWLLFSGTGAVEPIPVLSFKEAVAAALKADSTLSALIAGRVNPTKLSATKTYPALTFRVVTRAWSSDLDGFAGTCDAEVEFKAHSDRYGDCEKLVLAVRKLFDSRLFPATLSGVVVNFAVPRDDDDDYDAAEDASDRGTFTDSISILFSYVLA